MLSLIGRRRNIQALSLLTLIFYFFSLVLSGIFPAETAYADTLQQIKTNNPLPSKNDLSENIKPSIPVHFITNQGQQNEKVSYYANVFAGTLFVTKNGELVYSLPKAEGVKSHNPTENLAKGWVIKEMFIGAQSGKPQGYSKLDSVVNYLIGNDESKWKRGIPTYKGVTFGKIYPGIEFKLESCENNVEKVFTIKPGADLSQVKIKLEGSPGFLKINDKGQLEIDTGLGPVMFTKPVAYQEKDGVISPVEVKYRVDQNSYGFEVGNYDKTRPLIIDP